MSVSILICVWNKLELTRRCLDVLLDERSPLLHEIVVVDNGSTDGTAEYLASLATREPLLAVLSPGQNLGFVGGNNLAAAHATGDYLVFLNNDTEPRNGWLEALVGRIEGDATVGAVGAKLVYPDGRLQEAGGIVFSDASGWNYGRGDDPDDPRYGFAREVDYCSGACLLVPRELFERLGRFDRRYAPAYYEDTDLCFAVREQGLRVVYEPRAEIVHHEGATAGTDLGGGMKQHQVLNQERFREKWAAALADQHPPDPSLVRRASNRATGARLLVVDPMMPMHDRASGSHRLHRLLCLMAGAGHAVTFIARNGFGGDDYRGELEARGIEVYAGDAERLPGQAARAFSIARLLQESSYDLAWLSFYYIAEQYGPLVREHSPLTRVVFDTVDVHHVRERREAELVGDRHGLEAAENTRRRELAMARYADLTVAVTPEDSDALLTELPGLPVAVVPNVHEPTVHRPGPDARSGLLFVGNFRHPPNIDAAELLVREVLPRVRAELPDIQVEIVGADPPAAVLALAGPGVEVTGWVPDVTPYLERARVSVAPLRYGAGMKGKIGEALAHGVPVVTTPVGAEGIAPAGEGERAGILVGDDPAGLARSIVALATDDELWGRLSVAGPSFVDARFGPTAVAAILDDVLRSQSAAVIEPRLTSIVILARDELELTRACIASIDRSTPEPYELILVDNGSSDGTSEWFEELGLARPDVTVILNRSNRGFAAGCNQGLAVARGDAVLLLNNDTVVTPGWLGRMRGVLEREPRTGIVGPVSNRVAGPQLLEGCDYDADGGLEGFAKRIAEAHAGVADPIVKVVGFCLLTRREVVDAIGGLDERFGSGNFEDDDFCFRALAAGFESRVARDVFVHHEGSRTFTASGIDHERAMLRNWTVFKELWGLPADASLEAGYAFGLGRRQAPIRVPIATLARSHGRIGRRWVEDPVRRAMDALEASTGVSEAEALAAAFAEIEGWSDVNRRYEVRCKLVRKVLDDGRFDADLVLAAAAGLIAGLDEQPSEPILLNELGVLMYGLGQGKAAEALFLAARRLDPGLPGIDDNVSASRALLRAGGASRISARTQDVRALAAQAVRVAQRARPDPSMRISLCMIVKDEEEMLGRSLAAAAPAVDEIVVVDTGSTDRTVEIAESFGATVVHYPWTGSFAEARNVSIERATGDWILWLDADEVIADGDAPRLRALAAKTWREGFYVEFVNHLGDGSAEGFAHTTMRLFRNRPTYRFVGRVHEQHTENMPMGRAERFERTDIRVDHYGYQAERVRARGKSERNRALLEQVVDELGADPFTDFNLGTECLVADDPHAAVPHLVRAWSAVRDRPLGGRQFVPSLGVRLLQAHRLAGDPGAALAVVDDILRLAPGHTDVVREAALSARALGDLERAAELTETCLELGDAPTSYAGAIGAGTFLALGLLASIRAEQGRYVEAEQLLERSLRDHPRWAPAAAALADVRAVKAVEALYAAAVAGDGARLVETLSSAETVPPGHRSLYAAWSGLLAGGAAALDVEAVVAAAGVLERLLREQRFDAFEVVASLWSTAPLPERELREVLAGIYLAHGYLDSAAEEWLAVASTSPDARALLGLARVALGRGLVDDVMTLAAEALRLDPALDEARALISNLPGSESAVAIAS